jgi:glycine dehydrogenase subunit 1
VFTGSTYNEFILRCPDANEVNRKLEAKGIIGGYDLEKDYPELKNCLLFCATEMLKKEDIDRIIAIIA